MCLCVCMHACWGGASSPEPRGNEETQDTEPGGQLGLAWSSSGYTTSQLWVAFVYWHALEDKRGVCEALEGGVKVEAV